MIILKKGDKGQSVRQLQKKLSTLGFYSGLIDGDFGGGTEGAVKAFQKSKGLLTDGIVGDRVHNSLKGGELDSKQLTDDDITRVAKSLRCPEAAIRAVSEVESAGGGFHNDGTIKVLFERHIMSRYLRKAGLTLLEEMASKTRPDLVNRTAGGYRGGKLETTRLQAAAKLNSDVAYQSVSIGRYQIMGFHFGMLGFKSAELMYIHLSESEGNQLNAFAKFIRNDKNLHKALKSQDWTTFARIYNGPKFAENQYDKKLTEAFARHSI
jgi:peptidoglycan hydrolase-like protein with peptidoglycan-binding domain